MRHCYLYTGSQCSPNGYQQNCNKHQLSTNPRDALHHGERAASR